MPPSPVTIPGRDRAAIVDELRGLLPRMESGAPPRALPFGLPALDAHLPQGGLTLGALHEVAPAAPGDVPAAFGFLVALLARHPLRPPVFGKDRAPTNKPVLFVASARALRSRPPVWPRLPPPRPRPRRADLGGDAAREAGVVGNGRGGALRGPGRGRRRD